MLKGLAFDLILNKPNALASGCLVIIPCLQTLKNLLEELLIINRKSHALILYPG